MGVILFIVALILSLILVPIGFIFTLVKSTYKRRLKTALKRLNGYFYTMAYSIDQYGNVVCQDLFNWALIKSNSKHLFGDPDETISSVLGKNKINNTLTFTGKVLDYILHFLDNNHSINSIEE